MSLPQTPDGDRLQMEACEAVFRAAPVAMALVAPIGAARIVVLANDAFRGLFGRAVEGRRLVEVFRGTAASQMRHAVKACLDGDQEVRLRIVHAQGAKVVRLQAELRRLLIDLRPHVAVVVSLAGGPHRLAELGEGGVLAELGPLSRGMVYIHNVSSGVLRYGRHPLVARLGLTGGPLDIPRVRDGLHPEDLARFDAHAAAELDAPDHRVTESTLRIRAADRQWLWLNIRSRVFTRDGEGKVQRVIGVATDVTDAHNHAAAMAEAARALAHTEMAERQRIGRELHDSTAQLLVAASLGLASLERQAELGGQSRETLEQVRRAVDDAQHEIRNFSYMLHPPSLEQEGLETTLQTFAAGFARRTGLRVSVKVGRRMAPLPFAVQVAFFRVAQEALMNVYRHARASTATVRLTRLGGGVVLEVEDDGVGFAVGVGGPARGVGISGMQARMTQLGGHFELLRGAVGMKLRASVGAGAAGKRGAD